MLTLCLYSFTLHAIIIVIYFQISSFDAMYLRSYYMPSIVLEGFGLFSCLKLASQLLKTEL
jgi:hypothetical protein